MTIKDAEEIIRKFDPSFFKYWQNNAWSFSSMQIVGYAQYLAKTNKEDENA